MLMELVMLCNRTAKIRYSDGLIGIFQQFAIPQMENVAVLLSLFLRVFVNPRSPPPPSPHSSLANATKKSLNQQKFAFHSF